MKQEMKSHRMTVSWIGLDTDESNLYDLKKIYN